MLLADPAANAPAPGIDASAAPSGPVEPDTPAQDPRPPFLAARAAVDCRDLHGEAVFVAPDRALASIPCPGGQARLRLADGRELLGRAVPGAPAGTSILEVPGAGARFVPAGAASTLEAGAPLLAGIHGAGPGAASDAAARGLEPVEGRPFLRVAEAEGPLEGGIADGQGRLVAVAPSAPIDPDRPWYGIPAEAFGEPRGSERPAAWAAAAEVAEDEERRAQGDLWNRLRRSAVLVGAAPGTSGVDLVVARAGAGRPPAETVSLALDPPVWGCAPTGRIVEWRTGRGALDGLPVSPGLAARLSRLAPPAGGGAVWIGIGSSPLDCDLSGAAPGTAIAVAGSDPVVRILLPPGAPPSGAAGGVDAAAAPAGDAGPDPAEAARAAEAEQAAAFEEGWRNAFREANGRVAEARRRREELQALRDEARQNFQYVLEAQIEPDLEAARQAERRAAEDLHELDRKASLEAVPRAWRRPE